MNKKQGFDEWLKQSGLKGNLSDLLVKVTKQAYETGYEDALEHRQDIIGQNGNIGYVAEDW